MKNYNYFKKIEKKNWFKIVYRNHSPFFHSFLRTGTQKLNKELKFDNRVKHQMVLNNNIYNVKEDIENLGKRIIIITKKDKLALNKYLAKVENDCKRYLLIIQEISNEMKNFNKKTNDKSLTFLFNKYIKATLYMMSHLLPLLAPEESLIAEIEKRLNKYINTTVNYDKFKEALQLLIAPIQPSSIQKRKVALLKLAILLKNKKIKMDSEKISKIYEKYKWISDLDFVFKYETKNMFINELVEESQKNPEQELKKIKSYYGNLKYNKNKLIKNFKFDKNFILLINDVSRLSYMRLLRLEVIMEGGYLLKENLFKAISDKLNLANITDCYYWEMLKALRGEKINKEKIKVRKQGFGLIVIGKKIKELNFKESKKLNSKIDKAENYKKEFIGQIANQGKVRGIAKIVMSSKQFANFHNGDILVTHMTMPEYVPIMKKAAAIVTDEGGISCHAAIISRELGKPCIIGTKIATKALKDGDYIEVDANKGMVRKIN